ncbi:uncharacterized protein CTRU02_204582 [Colletotrichum truncatum]|uniref:Uncharacterized protein n=1 Tax=Colletotrichum truncatum TaxID=5467 RepID=A0ACC3ZCG1_COLTU|nr:uncharacterized protein CTRU02_02812 [Colletotrichum truncatum]KAF6797770.1 hypothetical protein CTRU02_02812 [Colletotrichum truncatum]
MQSKGTPRPENAVVSRQIVKPGARPHRRGDPSSAMPTTTSPPVRSVTNFPSDIEASTEHSEITTPPPPDVPGSSVLGYRPDHLAHSTPTISLDRHAKPCSATWATLSLNER